MEAQTQTHGENPPTDAEMRERRLGRIRDLVDFFDANPDMPLPHSWQPPAILSVFVDDMSGLRRIVRAFGGRWEKDQDNTRVHYTLRREIHPGLTICLHILHAQVCEAITTKVWVPARPAEEGHHEDRVEWRCPPSIFKSGRMRETDGTIDAGGGRG